MTTKIFFSIVSLILSLIIFIPYYIGIWKKETKPHVLTWLTWFILTALGFILSYSNGGGAGSLTFALQSFFCLTVVVYALYKKEKNITRGDWVIFAGAVIITFFYIITKDALLSAAFAATIDSLGYVPTFRKSYLQPRQEPIATYAFSLVSWAFSIGALNAYNAVTLIYPLTTIVANGSFVIFLLIRRKVILNSK